jgi:chemotaxis protein MotB
MRKFSMWTAVAVLAGIWASGCGVSQEQYDRSLAKNKALQSELDKVRKDKESMQVRLGSLETDLEKVRAALKEMDALKAALARSKGAKAKLDRLRAKMAAERALNAKLRAQFRRLISAGQLRIVNVNGRLVIKMASRILFNPGRAVLSVRGRRALRSIGKVLAKIERHFQVAGHSDNQPIKKSKYKTNWELAAVRAVNVVDVLRKAGVPGSNVSAASFAEFQPVSTNRTGIGRRLNRRIEITLLPVIPKRTR